MGSRENPMTQENHKNHRLDGNMEGETRQTPSEQSSISMQQPAGSTVTVVETSLDSHTSTSAPTFPLHTVFQPFSPLVHRSFFPGNAGQIDYERLARGRDELPHTSYEIKTDVGSIVGLHEYSTENTTSNIIIILAHGNTRPTRFMKDLISSLLECDVRMVVGRDFVGYDSSSQVPCHNGGLEVAAHANDVAVLAKMTEKYPECNFILCGRSIGTFFWAEQLHHPKVIGAIGIVPLTGPASVIRHVLEKKTPGFIRQGISRLTSCIGFSQGLAAGAFPHGYSSPGLPGFTTKGFELGKIDPGARGKQIVLFPSRDDELIPRSNVEDLQSKLEAADCKIQIVWTEGGHRALPCSRDLRGAVDLISKG